MMMQPRLSNETASVHIPPLIGISLGRQLKDIYGTSLCQITLATHIVEGVTHPAAWDGLHCFLPSTPCPPPLRSSERWGGGDAVRGYALTEWFKGKGQAAWAARKGQLQRRRCYSNTGRHRYTATTYQFNSEIHPKPLMMHRLRTFLPLSASTLHHNQHNATALACWHVI